MINQIHSNIPRNKGFLSRGSLQSCCRASRQHHFRSTALETSTSVNRRRSLTAPQTLEVGLPDLRSVNRRRSLTAPQTLEVGLPDLRPFSPTPRDCSAAAPFTALRPGQAGPEGYIVPNPCRRFISASPSSAT